MYKNNCKKFNIHIEKVTGKSAYPLASYKEKN